MSGTTGGTRGSVGSGRLMPNVAANVAARVWSGVVGILVTPVYLRYLGTEAFGLVGIFLALQAAVTLADFGLSATLARELPRLRVVGKSAEGRGLVRVMERIVGVSAILVTGSILLLAPVITRFAFGEVTLPSSQVVSAVRLMTLSLAAQLVTVLYLGGLNGLEAQVQGSAILTVGSVGRAIGGVLAVAAFPGSTNVFFTVQALGSVTVAIALRSVLFRRLGREWGAELPSRSRMREVVTYSTGMMIVSLSAFMLTQGDKLILGKMTSLGAVGRYAVATTLAQIPLVLAVAISTASFPRLSARSAALDEDGMTTEFRRAATLLAVTSFPCAVVLIFFPSDVLAIWTRRADLSASIGLSVTLLSIGNLFQVLQMMPFNLLLARHGARVAAGFCAVQLAIGVTLQVALIAMLGEVGAAGAWFLLNVGGLPMFLFIARRYGAAPDLTSWLLWQVVAPLGLTLSLLGSCRIALRSPVSLGQFTLVILVALVSGLLIFILQRNRRGFVR